MKIDSTGKPLASSVPRPAAASPASSKPTEAPQQESVSINPLAAKMQAVESGSTQASFDADKVAAIRQAIAEGKFTVRTDAIADKLLAGVQDLLKD